MKLIVIVPTIGRRSLLERVLTHLELQNRPPDEVVVSAPDETHVEQKASDRFELKYVFGKTGSCAQRNQALELAQDRSDYITMFDDDFLPARDYLANVLAAFEQHPDWVLITGRIAVDGARVGGITFEQGLASLGAAEEARPAKPEWIEYLGGNCSNMSFRSRHLGELRFDERLVLHGWQEDIDFSSGLRRHGKIVCLSTLVGVHLGVRSGPAAGMPFGYAQIINPVYLVRKGTMPLQFALNRMGRNVAANLARSFRPEPNTDRWGRLKGNLLGVSHILRGKVEPEYLLKLQSTTSNRTGEPRQRA